MKVINVILIKDDVVNSIDSFGIFEEQLSNEVVQKAEKLFEEKATELGWNDDDESCIENFIEDGCFQNTSGSVCLCWSDI